jgi:hypothetical protein
MTPTRRGGVRTSSPGVWRGTAPDRTSRTGTTLYEDESMRGKTVKRLRSLSERKHIELVASGKLPPPNNWNEAKKQLRAILRVGKRRWKLYSNPKSLLSVDLSLSSRPRLLARHIVLLSSGNVTAV